MSSKRDLIEQAAVTAIQRGGLGNVSHRSLADEVGIKSASVHYHFPQKSDLVDALIDRYSEHFDSVLSQIDDDSDSLKDALDRFIAVFEQVVEDDRICMCGMLAAEAAGVPAETRARLHGFFRRVEGWLAERFRGESERLRTTLAPETLARVLLAGLEGAAMIDRAADRRDYLAAQRILVADWIG